jgi:uncharacterized protein (TIGR02996 family)
MTTEEAFLGDIAADPGNAAVRLIYADWLQEQGREDESYAWRWATARGKYPYVSPKGKSIYWDSGIWIGDREYGSLHSLPRFIFEALLPEPRGLRAKYKVGSVFQAFWALAQALRRLRDEVAIP